MPLPRVAIVGAPNAGKSTLFNRLLGRRKALVHREPGTTRDVNEEECAWEGRRILLADTGGLLGPDDSIFADLVGDRVLKAALQASVLVMVVDGRRGLTPFDGELARRFRQTGKPLVLAVNKIDEPRQEDLAAEFFELGFPCVIPISAEHGHGIGDLREAVASLLSPVGREEAPAPERRKGSRAGEIGIAISGRPNVGKSSLLNALVGEERTLVSNVPGTTRDSIDCLLARADRTYRIIDTAGIRRKGRVAAGPENLSVMSARRNIARADVVLVLMDATEAPTLQDLHVAGVAQQALRPFIVLLNKWDLLVSRDGDPAALIDRARGRLRFAPYAPILTISALTGLGIERILPLVDEVHEQASRRFATAKLNVWLQRAVASHRPPAARGREFKFFYIAQTGDNPPAFVAFTNSASAPHFSYRRYLESSLREQLGLALTPVSLQYRERPRRRRVSRPQGKRARRRAV